MAKMAELQPKIKALRAKYKKSKTDIEQRRQMNEEMMKLYKEHGVNPAGGCLPMLIQLPVFWGVFRMLVVSHGVSSRAVDALDHRPVRETRTMSRPSSWASPNTSARR